LGFTLNAGNSLVLINYVHVGGRKYLRKIDLTDIAQERQLDLTTFGRVTGRRHTVELWFAVSDGDIYLSHEGASTDWMKNLRNIDQVEFIITGNHFIGRARIVAEMAVFDRGKQALYHKYYGSAPADTIDDWFSESSVIEISAIKRGNRTAR
jgi:hypothetical protein